MENQLGLPDLFFAHLWNIVSGKTDDLTKSRNAFRNRTGKEGSAAASRPGHDEDQVFYQCEP